MTSDEYRRYRSALLESGATPEEVEQALAKARRDDAELAAGRCPDCGAPIRRYGGAETARLRGEAGLPIVGVRPDPVGEWVMYRCSRDAPPGVYESKHPCGFMVDRFEAEEAN